MKALNVLLVEDDVIEVMKFKRVLSSQELKHSVVQADNGEDALELLKQKDNLPDIILLDLNMPKLNGIEFLRILKADESLKYVPTIILTTSSNQKDLLECFKVGIAGYILKPLKYEDYVSKINKLLSYWSVNELITV